MEAIIDFHLDQFDLYHRAVATAYAAALLIDALVEAQYQAEEHGDQARDTRLQQIVARANRRWRRRKAKPAPQSFAAWREAR